jgi:hypothetical protein
MLSDNINSIKNAEALLEASRVDGVEVSTEKSKYVVMFCYKNKEKITIY